MKLPACAFCGGSLRRAARVILDWTFPTWRPRVGWCAAAGVGAMACLKADPVARHLIPADNKPRLERADIERLLREIAARGPGRVVGVPEL